MLLGGCSPETDSDNNVYLFANNGGSDIIDTIGIITYDPSGPDYFYSTHGGSVTAILATCSTINIPATCTANSPLALVISGVVYLTFPIGVSTLYYNGGTSGTSADWQSTPPVGCSTTMTPTTIAPCGTCPSYIFIGSVNINIKNENECVKDKHKSKHREKSTSRCRSKERNRALDGTTFTKHKHRYHHHEK